MFSSDTVSSSEPIFLGCRLPGAPPPPTGERQVGAEPAAHRLQWPQVAPWWKEVAGDYRCGWVCVGWIEGPSAVMLTVKLWLGLCGFLLAGLFCPWMLLDIGNELFGTSTVLYHHRPSCLLKCALQHSLLFKQVRVGDDFGTIKVYTCLLQLDRSSFEHVWR